jgi:excisionase family DNA binding protein
MVAYKQFPPNNHETNMARTSIQVLSRYVRSDQPIKLRVADAEHDELIELPPGVVGLLMDILGAMASGQSITLIPENAELTTAEAADILNVSRPFVIKLLEEEKIPYRKVGTHRRIRMEDVMNYKRTDDLEREAILDQLVADAQEQDMGYD